MALEDLSATTYAAAAATATATASRMIMYDFTSGRRRKGIRIEIRIGKLERNVLVGVLVVTLH